MTGEVPINALPWGTHFCHFYRTSQDLSDTVVPFLVAGIRNHERVLWVTHTPEQAEAARAALEREVPSLEERIAAEQVSIVVAGRSEGFDPEQVMQGWWEEEARALAGGYKGLRLTGDTWWLDRRQWDSFLEYERCVDRAFVGRRIIALCTYTLERCDLHDMLEVMNTHDHAMVRRDGKSHVLEDVEHRAAQNRRARLIEETVGVVSHELGTSLSAICMAAELMERRGADAQLAQRVLRAGQDIRRMNDDLLDLVRGRTTRSAKLVREPLDLNQLCLELVGELRQIYPGRAIEFHSDSEARGEWDAASMRRALFNLLKNAIVHGAPEMPVVIGTRAQGHRYIVEVRNRGAISDEMLERLFQPFERGPKSSGLGLGLYIAKQIIDSHGGSLHVRVSSEPHDEVVMTALL